jgi:hypothetical protein
MRELPTRSGLHATRPDFCNGTRPSSCQAASERDVMVQNHETDQSRRDLKAIWVASCIDEDNLMYYDSVGQRYQIEVETVKDYVKEWRHLFRPGISEERLKRWINEEKTKERKERLSSNRTKSDNVFRCVFRIRNSATKCDIPTISWGLELIDGHFDQITENRAEERANKAEARADKADKRAQWALLIALAVPVLTVGLTTWTAISQNAQKRDEIRANMYKNHAPSIIDGLRKAFDLAMAGDSKNFADIEDKIEIAYPTLVLADVIGSENDLLERISSFLSSCKTAASTGLNSPGASECTPLRMHALRKELIHIGLKNGRF